MNYSDRFTYTPQDLEEAQKCISNLNNYVNTPGYGQLNRSSTRFISGNKWYKNSAARRSLDDYSDYYGIHGDGAYGRQAELTQTADYALKTINDNIKALAQMDKTVQDYFHLGPPEQEDTNIFEFAFDNMADGAVIDTYNGVLSWINAGKMLAGLMPSPYVYRLSADDKLVDGGTVDAILGSLPYALGSMGAELLLTKADPTGRVAKAHAITQGSGVVIAHSLNEDGIVSVPETIAAVIGGSLMGTFLDHGYSLGKKAVSKGVKTLSSKVLPDVAKDFAAKVGLEVTGTAGSKAAISLVDNAIVAWFEEIISGHAVE